MLSAESLFDLKEFSHATLFTVGRPAWSALDNLKNYLDASTYTEFASDLMPDGVPLPQTVVLHEGRLLPAKGLEIVYGDVTKGGLKVSENGQELPGAAVIMAGAVLMGGRIEIGRGVFIESGAMVKSPARIGDCSEVRQGAYLRGYCLAGKRCVLGHATEVKHSIFLDDAKAGHFAYLGDSILGAGANLGAGTKFANLKFVQGNVAVHAGGKHIDTGRRKLGAILGDGSQTGCNSVTNPGTVFGKRCMLMPNSTAAGYYPDDTLIP